MVARFDGRNPRAEVWISEASSRLIVDIVEEQRAMIRAALRQNMIDGVSPRRAALDVVGRVNRATARREGGLIGLSGKLDADGRWSGQMGIWQNALDELTSGNPAQMRAYLDRTLRDRRFDPTVLRAIREGRAVPSDQAAKIAGRYQDRLLYRRGETIARTELLQALHHAQDEGIRQLIDTGKLKADQVTRTWDASEDSATRDSHRATDGQQADMDGWFKTGLGSLMRHPGDRSNGAPAEDVINCRCRVVISIDYIKPLEDAARKPLSPRGNQSG